MKTRSSHRLPPACLALALLGSACAAHAAVGVRVLQQEWNPRMPKEHPVTTKVNDASAVSDAVFQGWAFVRPKICAQLKARMGLGGAAGGQTLRDIDCVLDEKPTFTVTSAGVNALNVSLALSGYVAATTTTPTVLGSDFDPRFSLALTGHMQMTLTVQQNPNQTLRFDAVKFSLSNATIDTHNLSGDFLKFIVDDMIPFFGGPNFKQMAENAINGVKVDVANDLNAALGPVNTLLRTPSGAERVGIWGKPEGIVIAFGPPAITPPAGGSMFGALRWDTSKVLAPGSCESFKIAATVQTGPAKLLDPSGYFGDAPMRSVGTFQMLPGANAGECRYRLSGLAAGWPNEVAARSSIGAGKSAGNSIYRTTYAVVGDGWDGREVVPNVDAERYYVVKASLQGSAVVDPAATLKQRAPNPLDPRTNGIDRFGSTVLTPQSQRAVLLGQGNATIMPVAPQAKSALGAGAAAQVTPLAAPAIRQSVLQGGDTVALNPQPLPPGPSDASATLRALNAARAFAPR